MNDLTENTAASEVKEDKPSASLKSSTEIPDKTMTVTIDSKGRSVDDSALVIL